jgi:hypothetical protein
MFKNVDKWIWPYLKHQCKIQKSRKRQEKTYIVFSICDHFEPYWQNKDDQLAEKRVMSWYNEYPKIARQYVDCCGQHPQHMFYYPIEEYKKEYLDILAEIENKKFGEVEIHLHHDNDTSENLRKTLLAFKEMLRSQHGLLSVDKVSGDVKYGFIHGNWALCNSRPDGRYCGVKNELTVLRETGCYADFTLPSAPSDTQTKTINSIYYAINNPSISKSHDVGIEAEVGKAPPNGLLCVQGPLLLNFYSRKLGLIPRIENSALSADYHFSDNRLALWISANIHVKNRPDVFFIKTHTHGTQDRINDYLLKKGGLDSIFSSLVNYCKQNKDCSVIFASSRQMYNIIKGLEAVAGAEPPELLNFSLIK